MIALPHPRRWSLSLKLPLTITFVVACVGFIIGAAIVFQERAHLRGNLEERALLMARSVAVNSFDAVASQDYWGVYKSLKQMTSPGEARDPLVMAAMVLDNEGRVIAHLEPRHQPLALPLNAGSTAEHELLVRALDSREARVAEGDDFFEGVVPVRAGETRLGVVRLRLSTAQLDERTRSTAYTVLAVTLMLVAAGSVLGTMMSNRMVRPLKDLARSIETFGESDLGGVAPVRARDRDEIGQVVESWNRMAGEVVEKRRLERQIAVGEKLVALGRISAGVAHEINNPLAGMLNCLDTIERHGQEPGIVERYLPLLKKGLHRIQGIVQGLLVELRAEGAEDQGSGVCLDDVRDLVAAEIAGQPIEFRWNNALGEDACVNCRRIQQVALNLLRNAVQAMPAGGRLDFRAYVVPGQMVVEVEDTGVGIPAERMSQIFDPFFTLRPNGTGLGLWITYRLIESMNGRIEVESEEGVGTLFRVRLAHE